MPRRAVIADQQGQLFPVVKSLRHILSVALALIPDGATDAIRPDGMDHRIENMGWILIPEVCWPGNEGRWHGPVAILDVFACVDLGVIRGEFLAMVFQGLGFRDVLLAGFPTGGLGILLPQFQGARVVLLNLPRHPTLDRGSGIGLLNNPHRNAEFELERLAKIVGNGRGFGGGFRVARFPLGEPVAGFFQGFMPVLPLRFEDAIVGQVGRRRFCLAAKTVF